MKEVLYNEKITSANVRLIDDGKDLGIMSTKEAMAIANEKGLDLVVISSNATQTVAKLLDYQKYIYEIKKKEKKQKKMSKAIETKTIQIRYCIDNNDLKTKLNHTREFLENGNKVIILMKFRKKEIKYIDQGKELLDKILVDLNVTIDKPLNITDKSISVTLRK